jgi:hypothetical protein
MAAGARRSDDPSDPACSARRRGPSRFAIDVVVNNAANALVCRRRAHGRPGKSLDVNLGAVFLVQELCQR